MSNISSGRPSNIRTTRLIKGRESNSPTLTSSRSERSLWARSYKNEPIPAQLRAHILGKKYQFDDSQDEDEEIVAVEEQQEQQIFEKKRKILPRFKVISDWGEFSDSRKNRIYSQRKSEYSPMRCHSVSSLKLPQVLQEKRQDDEHRKRCLSKLAEFKDNNQFGQRRKGRRSSSEYTQVISRVQSLEASGKLSRFLPEQITEIDAEQTKSVKLPNQKSVITVELEKLIVDEIDSKKRKKDDIKEEIESIIQEEKNQEEVNTEKLRQSLSKFQSESEYLANDQLRYSQKQEQEHQIVEEESEKSDDS